MKRIVWKFGLLGGVIVAVFTAILFPMCLNGTIKLKNSEVLGYTAMVLAYLMVFAGIRSYREQNGGTITFGKAFQVGILITLVTCMVYVVSWEIVYYGFLPDFGERYATAVLARAKETGASPAVLAKKQHELADFAIKYHNPFFNVGMTFLEVFPVGLIMTLVAAGILRRSEPREPERSVVAA